MAPRAIWKGQLRLSLVSIPVEVYSARESGARVSFRQIHAPSGKPVRYEKTVPGIGPIDTDDIVKGYDTGEGDYILIDPEEVEDIRLETKKTLELVQFVSETEIPPIWFDRPYYVVPTDDLAEDAYRVIRDALRQTGKTGLGQMVMRGKEYLTALRPCGDGLLLETLHYADELRQAEPLFNGISEEVAEGETLDLATSLIERKTAPFDPDAYHDRYAAALSELIAAKRQSRETPRAPTGKGEAAERGGENVVDLMDALRKSLDAQEGGSARGGRRSSGGGKSSAAKSGGAKSSGARSSGGKSTGGKSRKAS